MKNLIALFTLTFVSSNLYAVGSVPDRASTGSIILNIISTTTADANKSYGTKLNDNSQIISTKFSGVDASISALNTSTTILANQSFNLSIYDEGIFQGNATTLDLRGSHVSVSQSGSTSTINVIPVGDNFGSHVSTTDVRVGTPTAMGIVTISTSASSTRCLLVISTNDTVLFQVCPASVTAFVTFIGTASPQWLDVSGSTQTKTGGLGLSGNIAIGGAALSSNENIMLPKRASIIAVATNTSTAGGGSSDGFTLNIQAGAASTDGGSSASDGGFLNLMAGSPVGTTASGAFSNINFWVGGIPGFANAGARQNVFKEAVLSRTGLSIGDGAVEAAHKLDVYGAIRSTASAYFVTDTNTNGKVGVGTTNPSSKFDVIDGSVTIRGTGAGLTLFGPTIGGALCLNASNAVSKCTGLVDASGNCTCP